MMLVMSRYSRHRKCFRSPSKKMWKFSMQEGKRQHLFLVYMLLVYPYTNSYGILQVWGIISFILAWVIPQPS